MKTSQFITLVCLIPIILCLHMGCIENENKPIFDKNLELISVWWGITSEEVPISTLDHYMEMKSDEEELQQIYTSDDKSLIIITGVGEGFPYLLYQFLYDNVSNSIQITWEGYSSQPFISDKENKIDIYLYRPLESNWTHLYHRELTSDATDSIVKYSISKSLSQYIDEQNNFYFLFLGPYGNGDSEGTLTTDFIELKGA